MATATEPKAEAKAEPKEIEEISQPPLKYKESNHGGPGGSGDNEKETVKVEGGHAQGSGNKKKNEGGGPAGNKKADGGNMVKPNEGGGAPAKTGGGGQVKESKPEVVRQGGNLPNHPPVAEKKSGGPKGNANAEEDEGEECGAAPPSTGSPNHGNVHVDHMGPMFLRTTWPACASGSGPLCTLKGIMGLLGLMGPMGLVVHPMVLTDKALLQLQLITALTATCV
ncbi:heavy metal-associated isoprenylated plant protein 36 [Prunus yedoensis var. nudiflora]|uniref:Heavy metal-associated isoprenylated plant protein 36 n=1 Tax=Prunus yedoensis var. nudiflora TaxID=2094558 RepID=A0A314YG08_PRUYE|nr:heavy metal-associated isoprenylated plant protein 36 [Prunus yedoensis var. nudiflora]